MHVTHQIEESRNLIVFRFSGSVAKGELRPFFETLPDLPGFRPGLNALIDFREAEIDADLNSTLRFRDAVLEQQEYWSPSNWAVLAGSDVNLGNVFRHVILTETPHICVQLFDDEAEALRWLATAPPPPGNATPDLLKDLEEV